ncbi:MAG: S-adenosylmethionine:tRNA ribosyltransferase-isomerase, partial [uncultured Cytophagales bacterium]
GKAVPLRPRPRRPAARRGSVRGGGPVHGRAGPGRTDRRNGNPDRAGLPVPGVPGAGHQLPPARQHPHSARGRLRGRRLAAHLRGGAGGRLPLPELRRFFPAAAV